MPVPVIIEKISCLLVLFLVASCTGSKKTGTSGTSGKTISEETRQEEARYMPADTEPAVPDTTFLRYGLVDMARLDPTIPIRLAYAAADNFTGKVLYKQLRTAWLRPEAAAMLTEAQKRLRERRPELSLIIYDAARPFHVQEEMWNLVKGTPMRYYVANPKKGGGLHNYAMAVDVTLIDGSGHPLPMGSPYDSPVEESHITGEEALLAAGKITKEAYDNRLLLRNVMRAAGFRTIQREWWHFNACTLKEAREKYPLIP